MAIRARASVFALVLLSVSLSFPARAGVDRWTPLSSPLRGFVSPVVVDPERPSTLYTAGTDLGELWKSYDSGATWTLLRGGLDPSLLGGWDLRGPVFDPADSRRLWIWSAYTVWFSADGGGRWTRRQGPTDLQLQIEQIVPHPEISERLLALGDGTLAGETDVLVSEDGGATWTAVASLPQALAASRLHAHPSDRSVFYITSESGLFRSEDGAATWTLWSAFEGAGFLDLAIAPSRPSTVYAVPRSAPRDLLRSDDDGLTWTRAGLPEPRVQTAGILVDPEDFLRVRAIVQRGQEFFLLGSHDGGATWPDEALLLPTYTTPGLYAPAVVADPRTERILYATPELQRSTDGGRTWQRLGQDIQAGDVGSLAASRFGGRTVLYASVFDRDHHLLLRSGNSGATWRELPAPDLAILAADPHRGSRLWGLGLGVFRSDDRGKTWRRALSNEELRGDPTDLLVDPVRPRRVFVGTMFDGVWRTDDAGETWVQSMSGLSVEADCHHLMCPFVGPFAVDAGEPDRVFVVMDGGGFASGGLYRSLDGGAHWQSVGVGLPRVAAVAAHPSRPGMVWAGTADGVFSSEDGGESWSRLPGLSADVRQLLFDESTGQLYAVTGQGLFRWPRRGSGDWEPLVAGLPQPRGFRTAPHGLVADPSAPGRVYFTVPGLGVWTARFVGAMPLALPTGRFELRAALAGALRVAPGVPARLSPERGSFAAVADGPAHLFVELAAGRRHYRLVARAVSQREVELTVVDRLSGVARTYRLPRTKPRLLVDDRAFPVAPFARRAPRGR